MDAPMKWLTRKEQVQYLRERHNLPTTVGSLQKAATKGGGPKYRLWGNKAVSAPEWLDAWAEEKLSLPRSSTAEAASASAQRKKKSAGLTKEAVQ